MTTKTISVFTPEMLFRAKQTSTERKHDESYEILQEYFKVIDHPLRNTKYAHMPAKSVEYGKTDQPLLNHVRNGVQWIIELNTALSKSNSPSHLSASQLREVIALFSIHDFHKTVGKEWREQFNLTKDEVMGFVKAIHADTFAPNLSIDDFYSVAIATHPTRGYHGELSRTFHLYKDWILLADICASLEKPHVTESMRKHLAFIDKKKDLYYHTFSDSLGILTNLVHATVVEYVKPHGLIPLLYFERGVLYLGEQNAPCELTDPAQIEAIYLHLIEKIQSSHESLSQPEKLQKYIQVQGSKGLFSVEDSFFFYSGVRTVMKAFLAAAIMSRERENTGVLEVNAAEGLLRLNKATIDMQYPPADVIMIGASAIREITVDGKPRPVADVKITCHGDESRAKRYVLIPDGVFVGGEKVTGTVTISGIGLMPSMVGYRHHILEDFGIDIGWDESIIPLSRAVSGIRKDVITEMIKAGSLPSDDPLVETCRLFGVSHSLTEKMVAYATSHQNQDHHSVGGFWNYAYVIARDILDRTVDGLVFSQISSIQDRLSYLYGLVDAYLDTISPEDLETYQSQILYPYKEKLLVWLCENLDLNGSMLYGAYTNKTKKFQAYCEGTGICRLTNDTPYDKERKTTSQDVSMLKYTFSNRVPIGSSEPSLYVSVPVQIELGLRSIGHGIRKGSDKIYFRLIPDYHFSTTTANLFNQFANYFDGEAKTRILDIAREFLNTVPPSEDSIIGLLISETGRTNLCQYTGQGFLYQNCTFDFVFNKKRNGDGE